MPGLALHAATSVPNRVVISFSSTSTPPVVFSADSSYSAPEWIAVGLFIVRVFPSENGYIAEDIDSHTYGVGATSREAVEDWGKALLERFEVLRENTKNLAPKLASELSLLDRKLSAGGFYASCAS